ncbi:hypothetical protein SAMN06265365_12317 [Tistlia consotensis]|uniref:Uncharacterized protein n=1 Tax=Tistlia consotensis USBA 355 TaxID=560819 RepID=A0A1Y6CH12_9PROT|nr:hypothetical protein [Tistlia consotensis]SMF64745.1 hypothetical protein SAMN05428998_12592 [Tistlia consotensis USBA 355]SNR96770.1 hypothetical protein SAMN06265365_12317 [Tistlia consotensis]
MRLLTKALAISCCAAFPVAFAAAARADCTIPGYAADAEPRLGGSASCDDIATFNIQTPRGPRQVHMVRDQTIRDDWAVPVETTRMAIERSAETLREIGRGTVPNLLVVVTGLLPSATAPDPRDPEAVEADRRSFAEGVADGRSGDECLILVYPGNVAEEELDVMVAHEFFHCVQYALAPEQMRGRRAGRPDDWWVEGSAEWFANLAYPERDASASYLPAYDKRTPDHPIVDSSYDAFVFWSWYGRSWGPAAVLNYLHLAPDGGKAAQLDAAAEVIDREHWQEYLQDYLDRDLLYPDARRLPVNPKPGESFLWTEDATRSLKGERLALYRADLIFTCGRWTIETRDEVGGWKVRDPAETGGWRELPERIEVEAGEEKRFRLGGIGLTDEGFRLTIQATRDEAGREACGCGGYRERTRGADHDSCLVGTWRLTSGGLNEWLATQLEAIERASGTWASYDTETTADDEGRKLTVGGDGRYHYGVSTIGTTTDAYTEKGDHYGSRIRASGGGAGYWSTKNGILDVCALSEASAGTAELILKDERMTVRLPQYFSEHLYSAGYVYDCSEGHLHLRIARMPGAPAPMEWDYEKVGPGPPPDDP